MKCTKCNKEAVEIGYNVYYCFVCIYEFVGKQGEETFKKSFIKK